MNEKEIAEIRRRMRAEKNNIGRICGCYVNNNSIISKFNHTFGLISSDESEEILNLLRKVYSGSIGRNLINVSFTNQQVLDSEEHKLLTNLRTSSLQNDTSVQNFYEKIISNIDFDGSYLILLANDKYDVFTYDENGEKQDSSEIFSYIICAICPIKSAKPTLGYNLSENKFKNFTRDSIVCPPELGFMFPAFENKGANIYSALYYTKDISCSHAEFTNAIFNSDIPKPATEQTETIASIFNNTVAEECNLEFIQNVHSQLVELTSDHKANKIEEPLVLTQKDMSSLLRCSGVGENTVKRFEESFSSNFASTAGIIPSNVMDVKKFEVKTPEVIIKVKPEASDLVETRIIDGKKYILIRANEDVEVNGVKITFEQ